LKYKYLVLIFSVFYGCSTQKNTLTTRTYHNLTSHYNTYFNGLESYRKGIKNAENEKIDNFAQILPIFLYTDKDISQSVSPDMDKAAKKATKVITLHSITVKPELKKGPQTPKQKEFYNQREFNKWMDENYLLLGISYVYKNDFDLAAETFKHIISEYPHTPTKYNALIWLARCYIATNEYRESEKILNLLGSDEKMPARLKADFYTTFADFYFKQKNYEKTIPMLELALEQHHKKYFRIRYSYILAQIYQETGNLQKAAENYKKVIKLNPPYEMTFNAKINLAGSFDADKGEGKEIRSILGKMLKDDKNEEFQDQIYFALGKIALKENNIEEALGYFKQSTSKSSNNLHQKGLTYLTLGDLYYSKQDYLKAKLYYDSTLQNIDPDYENYNPLVQKAGSLERLVNNLTVYELEDSLQILAKMTDAERKNVIDKIIAEVINNEQEELKKSREENMNIQYGLMSQATSNLRKGGEISGKWYFYNPNAKSFGQPEFRLIWGNRKLEDNWRRKNKQTIEIFETDEIKETSDAETKLESKKISDNKNPEFYLKDIPLTEEALESSHTRLKEALYNAGTIYYEELNDLEKANISFKELIKRYPGDKLTVLSYYKLYDIALKKGDDLMMQEYKNLIISEFPDSPMAQILSNPEYLSQLQKEEVEVNKHYENVYSRYVNMDYHGVISEIEKILTHYPENKQLPRFLLLKALSIGQLQGKEKMKTELELIVNHYPEHESGIYARELIGFIYSQSPEIKIADIQQAADQLYSYVREEIHYLIVSVSKSIDINQLNFNLVNFNIDNYNNLNLGISQEELGDVQLIRVSSFSQIETAMKYRDLVLRDKEIFKGFNENDIMIFLISGSNLEKLLEDKNIEKYFLFYKKNYGISKE